MILGIFSVRDAKADCFTRPFVDHNDQTALRAWLQACRDPDTQFNKHPEDFTLYQVASFDDQTGVVTSFELPALIGQAPTEED